MNDDLPQVPPKTLASWSNAPKLDQLKRDYTDARTEADNQVRKVDTWLDNLHIKGKAKLEKRKNRSSIQPKLIRKQAEWRYSSLSEPFLSTPDIFNVEPVTFEDRQAAQQNALILNYQFNHKLNKVKFIDDYIRCGVDEGSIIVRTGWETEEVIEEVEVPRYVERKANSQQFMSELQQAVQMQQQAPEQFAQLPESLQRSVLRTLETNQPTEVFQKGSKKEKVTRVIKNQPTAQVCDYRRVVLDPSCEGDMDKAKFVVYEFTTSLEELRSAGLYDNLDAIQFDQTSPLAKSDNHNPDNASFNFKDEPRKRFFAYEYWGFWDIDGNGTVKPIVVTWAGNTIIRMDENPFPDGKLPFVVIPYLPVRNSLFGEPDGELITDNQEIVGAVSRGMIDILASNAAGQRGFRKDAMDTLNKRRFKEGNDYEYNGNVDPKTAFHTHAFAEIPQSAQFMYQQQNMEAESMVGVKAFASGLSGQALGDTATGIRGALDAASKRELGILRRLADGIIQIGKKFIAMNAEWLSDEEIIRVTNEQFVAIKREDLAGEFDLKLSISTAEEDNAKAQELAFMLQTTGPSSDPAEVRMIRAEIARLRKMPDLAKKIEEYQPQPDPMQQMIQQLEIQKLQAEIAEIQGRTLKSHSGAGLDEAKADKTTAEADLINLKFLEQESGVEQERELQKQGAQAEANMKLEAVKSALNPKPTTSK